jgi:hypothetical protein
VRPRTLPGVPASQGCPLAAAPSALATLCPSPLRPSPPSVPHPSGLNPTLIFAPLALTFPPPAPLPPHTSHLHPQDQAKFLPDMAFKCEMSKRDPSLAAAEDNKGA